MEGLGQSLVSDLVHLGLKEYEARVLIALVKSGRSLPASKLVSVSQVPRNKIYQVLESLIGLELAKMDEITGSANLYSLLYEPEKLSLILKKQLTEPIE
ncbi:MAG: helix-turn-helix domain-containing protein, partial [Candidatus Hodarchaeales archaeon]